MSKKTAHRPSQSNQQYVKNSKGEKVLNTAYQGNNTQQSHSDIISRDDFKVDENFSIPIRKINDSLTKDHNKNVNIVKKELSRFLVGYQEIEVIKDDNDPNCTYFSIGEDDRWGAPKKFYRLKNNTLERNMKILSKWGLSNTEDDAWSIQPKNNLQKTIVIINDIVADNYIEEPYEIIGEYLGNKYEAIYDSPIQVDYYTDNVIKDKSTGKYYNISAQESGWDFSINDIYEVEPKTISIDKFEPVREEALNYQSLKLNKLLEDAASGETDTYYSLPQGNETDLEIIEVHAEDDSLAEYNPLGTGFNLSSSEDKQNSRYYYHGRIYHDKDTNEYLAVQFNSASEDVGNWYDDVDIIKNDDGSYSSETGGMWKIEKTGETNNTIFKKI